MVFLMEIVGFKIISDNEHSEIEYVPVNFWFQLIL